jgi:hypothetical protein
MIGLKRMLMSSLENSEHLYNKGFRLSHADPDVWLRPAPKPSGEKYVYALCYVDNVLAFSASQDGIMKSIQ